MTIFILKFLVNTCILLFCWWWSSQCLEFHSLLLNVDNLEREREREEPTNLSRCGAFSCSLHMVI